MKMRGSATGPRLLAPLVSLPKEQTVFFLVENLSYQV
jgi:hypothetical protein